MKKAIVIPTWKGHFWANKKFLESFNKNAVDASLVNVYFIVSNEWEVEKLKEEILTLRLPSTFLSGIHVVSILSILKEYGVSPEDVLTFDVNSFSNKFSYQSIKKLFGVIHSGADKCLVIDSEAFFLKKTCIADLFNNYFSNPFIFISTVNNTILNTINKASYSVISEEEIPIDLQGRWIFEYPAWFFEKSILRDFISHVEKLHGTNMYEVLYKIENVFEVVAYYWFIYLNRNKYTSYKFINTKDYLTEFLDVGVGIYLEKFANANHGIIEHFLLGLDSKNFDSLQNFANSLPVNFFRVERRYAGTNFQLVKKFVKSNKNLQVICGSEELEFFIPGMNKRKAIFYLKSIRNAIKV